MMTFLRRLFAAPTDPREAMRPVWDRIVAIAREPHWYRDGGVADTLEGRFDMISAVLALVLIRMEREPALAARTAALTEIFVEEMDGQLRQSGVGDLMVGKHIGRLMAALGGRVGAYRTALANGPADMAQAVCRNITSADPDRAETAAERLRALAERLDAADGDALMAGDFA